MAINVVNIGGVPSGTVRNDPLAMEEAKTEYDSILQANFARRLVLTPIVENHNLEAGTTKSIPFIGKIDESDVQTHTAGTELVIGDIATRSRLLQIGPMLYHRLAIDLFEERIMHFDTRAQMAKEQAEVLASKMERKVAEKMLEASQASGIIKGARMEPDGSEVNNDNIDSGATPAERGNALLDAVFSAQALLESKDITDDMVLVVSPKTYVSLVQSNAIHHDLTAGTNGGLDTGKVGMVAGIPIVKTNYLPTTPVDVGGTSKKLQALLISKRAVGVIRTMEVMVENYRREEMNADFIQAKMSFGAGVLHPSGSCAITGGNA